MDNRKTSVDVLKLVRKNILNMKAYSSARDEFKGEAEIFLDANENPYPSAFNRYPDPLQWQVKEKLARIKNVNPEQIFLGNGSDEAIDLIIRAFCEPYKDSILITEPTYGMYAVCADLNAITLLKVDLTKDFDLDVTTTLNAVNATTKIIFLCSPNNPSGNLLDRDKIASILEAFDGLVVIDEAYNDFTGQESFSQRLPNYANLVVLQTFSKAWGLAGLRLGMAFGSKQVIDILNKIKYPYNVNTQTQALAIKALDDVAKKEKAVAEIIQERSVLADELVKLPITEHVYPSDANFLLVKFNNAPGIYKNLMERGIIVRDRSKVRLCANCIRITVGTPKENKDLISALKNL